MKKIFLLTIVFNILLVSCQHIEKKNFSYTWKRGSTREMDRPAKIGITGSLWSSNRS